MNEYEAFEIDFKDDLEIDFEKYKIKGITPHFSIEGSELKQWKSNIFFDSDETKTNFGGICFYEISGDLGIACDICKLKRNITNLKEEHENRKFTIVKHRCLSEVLNIVYCDEETYVKQHDFLEYKKGVHSLNKYVFIAKYASIT